jgi:guanine nucleotide-binding protein subunit alpha
MKQFLVFRHILILHISPFRLSKISAICSLCMGRSAPLASPVDEDPLTLALAPPPDETYEQRLVREAAEVEAKRISDEIDEQLRRERELEKKKKKPIKLLLLGSIASLC